MANGTGIGALLGEALVGAQGRQVVAVVSHSPTGPAGFERLSRDALVARMAGLRRTATEIGSVQVLCLHVPHDTVVPPVVGREADVVLVVAKARHG